MSSRLHAVETRPERAPGGRLNGWAGLHEFCNRHGSRPVQMSADFGLFAPPPPAPDVEPDMRVGFILS